jgi:hypothetical protein
MHLWHLDSHALADIIIEDEEARVGCSAMIDEAYVSHKKKEAALCIQSTYTTFVL